MSTTVNYSRPKALDLFSGCGGMTEGLRQAGFNVIGAVEIDPFAAKAFVANHGRTVVWTEDIRHLSSAKVMETLELHKGELDLIAGCPPCQGFSTIRTKNGSLAIDDPRNDLLMEFQRFVSDLLPRAVLMENVPGLVGDSRFDSFIEVLKDLEYISNFDILDAADYGVPQRRERLVLLAGHGVDIPLATPSMRRRVVRHVLSRLPAAGNSGDPLHDFPENRSDRIKSLISKIPRDGGSRRDLDASEQLQCHQKCDGFKDVYGRMAWNDVAPTLTTGCFNPSKGRFLHPEENRAITMREAALLQTFPRRYKFPTERGKTKIAELIGNAVPPKFLKAQAVGINQVLKHPAVE